MSDHYFNLAFAATVTVFGIKAAFIIIAALGTARTCGNWIALSVMCLMVAAALTLAYMSASRIVRDWNKRSNND